jgi:hypothetical protein
MFPHRFCHELHPGRCRHCGQDVMFARRLLLWIGCWRLPATLAWECAECGWQTKRPANPLGRRAACPATPRHPCSQSAAREPDEANA